MKLPNRRHTAVYKFFDGEITLQGNWDNMSALFDDTGVDPLIYCSEALNIETPYQVVQHITNIVYHYQIGAEKDRATKEQIADWLFGVMDDFFTTDNLYAVAVALAKVMGKDIADRISELDAGDTSEKKDDSAE